ncbi:FG-GAP-like repeat-containing protein [Thermoproteota archaeon]
MLYENSSDSQVLDDISLTVNADLVVDNHQLVNITSSTWSVGDDLDIFTASDLVDIASSTISVNDRTSILDMDFVNFSNSTLVSDITTITTANLTVSSDSTLSADSRGCTSSQSPDSSNVCSSRCGGGACVGYGEGDNGDGYDGAGGAGHGGYGGRGESGTNVGGYYYGSALRPSLKGSGGGGYNGETYGGTGGGVIRLVVNNSFVLEGVVESDGGNGAYYNNDHAAGGGSGGSVWITTYNLSGSGLLRAVGGAGANAGNADGGGGAGGRIAVYFNESAFTTMNSAIVSGGSGPDGALDGESGTLWFVDTDDEIAWIRQAMEFDGTDYATDGTLKPAPDSNYSFRNVTTLTNARIRFDDDVVFNASYIEWTSSPIYVQQNKRLHLMYEDISDTGATYNAASGSFYFSFEEPDYGKVEFIPLISSFGDLGPHTEFRDKEVYINTNVESNLNTSAEISMYNIPFPDFNVSVDWDDDTVFNRCPGSVCSYISYLDGIAKFGVTHFTTYRIDSNETEAPVVNLMLPLNNTDTINSNFVFTYNVSDVSDDIRYCDLILNNEVFDTDYSITEDVEQNFTVWLTAGQYNWSVNCTDESSEYLVGSSETRNLTVSAVMFISEDVVPNPVNRSETVTVSGLVDFLDGFIVPDNPLNIYIDGNPIQITGGTTFPEGWFNLNWSYRTNFTLNTGYAPRSANTIVKNIFNFTEIMEDNNISGTFDADSIRITNEEGDELEFDILRWLVTNSTAMVRWRLNTTGMLSKETDYTYYIYFDTIENGVKDPAGYTLPYEFFICSGADGNNDFRYAYSNNDRTLPTTWYTWDPLSDREKDETTIFDFDNDGDYDIAWTSDNYNYMYTYRNNGGSSWSFTHMESHSSIDYNWNGICHGDFNEDGWMDMVVEDDNAVIRYYQNDGDGTFTYIRNAGDGPGEPRKMACADLNGDNNMDIVAGTYSNGCLWWIRGDGDGTFGTQSCITNSQNFGDDWHGVWTVDADQDGDVDVYGKSTTAYATFFQNNGGGSFTNGYNQDGSGRILDTNQWGSGSTGDYDNDGLMDLTQGSWTGGDGFMRIYWGDDSYSNIFNSNTPSSGGGAIGGTTVTTGTQGYQMFCGGADYVQDVVIGETGEVETPLNTNASAHYNYTFTAPNWGGFYNVSVNTSYLGYYAENSTILHVHQVPIVEDIALNATAQFNRTFHLIANITDDNLIWVNFTVTDPDGIVLIDNVNATKSADGLIWNTTSFTLNKSRSYNYTMVLKDWTGYTETVEGVIDFIYVTMDLETNPTDINTTVVVSGWINWSNGTALSEDDLYLYFNNTLLAGGAGGAGDSSDGELNVTSVNTIVNSYAYLTGNEGTGQTVLTVNSGTAFEEEDYILIYQTQSGGGGTAGTYEFATVESKLGNDLTLTEPLNKSFYSGTFNAVTSTSTQVVRIPQYTTVTVNPGASIVAKTWDGYSGGIVALLALDTVDVENTLYDNFTGTVINTSMWAHSPSYISQNEYISMAGVPGTWVDSYIFSSSSYARTPDMTFQGKFYAIPGTENTMVGFKDNTGGYSYQNMPYALYFSGNGIHIYEDGNSRFNTGFTYSDNTWYDFKIVLKSAGANYFYKASSSSTWQLVYSSTYSTESNLRPGLTSNSGTRYIDDLQFFVPGISAKGKGFRTPTRQPDNQHGRQGEGYIGVGVNTNTDNRAAKGNGGGGGQYPYAGAGGGGYSTAGQTGTTSGSGSPGIGGNAVGNAQLSVMHFGGAGGTGGDNDGNGYSNDGGDGGGIVFVAAGELTGRGNINSEGNTAPTPATQDGRTAGGAGGTVWLQAVEIDPSLQITAVRGSEGRSAHITGTGGRGGYGSHGRIRLDYLTNYTGSTLPAPGYTGTFSGGSLFSANASGFYTFNITSPSTPGRYNVTVNATKGIFYGENTKVLVVHQIPVFENITLNATAEYNKTFHLIVNMTDENMVWLNITITDPDGIKIVEDKNETTSDGIIWNSSSFTLNKSRTYFYNVTVKDKDGYVITQTGPIDFLLISMDVFPNPTAVNYTTLVSGCLNWTNGTYLPDHLVNIYLNNTALGGTGSTLGDGSDGAVTITSANTVVNDYTYLTGNEASGQTGITVNDNSAFEENDTIMIIQMQNYSNGVAGQYEFAEVSRIVSGSGAAGTQSDPGLSCYDILMSNPSSTNGSYWIDPDGAGGDSEFEVFCDMSTDGGGWTLVWSNTREGTGKPVTDITWTNAIDGLSIIDDTISSDLESFNYYLGLDHWEDIGTELRYDWANDYGSPIDQQFYADFYFDESNYYAIKMSNHRQTIGSTTAGLWETHNNQPFTTYDSDHDQSGGNCAASFSNTPWWYTSCWDGSINGGGERTGSGYYNGAYWDGSALQWGTDAGVGAGNGWIFVRGGITSIELTEPLNKSYYSGTFDTTSATTTQVVRVPQYTQVTVNSTGSITAPAWNGYTGGIVVFRASENITVAGSVTVDSKGYRGTAHGCRYNQQTGTQGESYIGAGQKSSSANGHGAGGGACGSNDGPGGGGGGHANAGSNGESYNCAGGIGGSAVGTVSLDNIYFGGAGGEGKADEDGDFPGYGGDGGGIIIMFSQEVTVTGSVTADGQNGGNAQQSGCGGSGSGMASGGGGAGGSVYVAAENMSIGSGLVSATGGSGGTYGADGGAGSVGRVRLDYNTQSGSSNPAHGYNESFDTGLPQILTNSLGCYAFNFTAPLIPGVFNMSANATEGPYYAESRDELTVLAPTNTDVWINETLYYSPATPKQGDIVEINATVYNNDIMDHSNVIVGLYVDGELVDTTSTSILMNSSANVSLYWTAAPWNRTIRVKVDVYNDILEPNEDNNDVTTYIFVRKTVAVQLLDPDNGTEIIRGDDTGNEDPEAYVPDTTTLQAYVYNYYNDTEGVVANCSFYFDGAFLGTNSTSEDGYCNYTFNHTSYSAGARDIWVNFTDISVNHSQHDTANVLNDTVLLVVYESDSQATNTRTGTEDFYLNGDSAILELNVTKDGVLVDITNITVEAWKDGPDALIATHTYPGDIVRTGVGEYYSLTVINDSFNNQQIHWKFYMDDNQTINGTEQLTILQATSGTHEPVNISAATATLNITVIGKDTNVLNNTRVRVYDRNLFELEDKTIITTDPYLVRPATLNDTYDIQIDAENLTSVRLRDLNVTREDFRLAPQIVINYTGYMDYSTPSISTVVAMNGSEFNFTNATLSIPLNELSRIRYIYHCDDWSFSEANCSNWQRQELSTYPDYTINATHFSFTVDNFTGYGGGEGYTANITIYDEFEGSRVNNTYDIAFYANYTNFTSGEHIPGAVCTIRFDDDTSAIMTDTGSQYNYTKVNGFLFAATHEWNVTCVKSGFDDRIEWDDVLVTQGENRPPVIENVILNATYYLNRTFDNLTLHWTGYDLNLDPIKNTTNWFVDGSSITVLNMPFEPDLDQNATDYSTHGNNGTNYGATFNKSGGYDGFGAYEFDGDDDYILIQNSSSLNLSNNDFAISLWTKFDGFNPSGFNNFIWQGSGELWGELNFHLDYKSSTNETRIIYYNASELVWMLTAPFNASVDDCAVVGECRVVFG